MKRVLILCTGNSARSQMAEGLWRELGRGEWEAFSAGTAPAGAVHPLAIQVLAELGIDISRQETKHVGSLAGRRFDLAITVCSGAAEACPRPPGAARTLQWPLPDPAAAGGSEKERRAVFRAVRDELRARIEAFLAEGPAATA
ncbi:MAG: arsenate reductase ArsC [Planctomycetota bacterium]